LFGSGGTVELTYEIFAHISVCIRHEYEIELVDMELLSVPLELMEDDLGKVEDTATHCHTLQNTATHCHTLQNTATHCHTLQNTATHCNTLHHTRQGRNSQKSARTARHCKTMQHTATHCNTLQHTWEDRKSQKSARYHIDGSK